VNRPPKVRLQRTANSVKPIPVEDAASARAALAIAWAEMQAVSDWLAAHPAHADRCRLAMRETFAALLVIDRVAATLE
jgi:hypothetical protein